jgi:hypothetical protein
MASERIQIALYRLQRQEDAVVCATEDFLCIQDCVAEREEFELRYNSARIKSRLYGGCIESTTWLENRPTHSRGLECSNRSAFPAQSRVEQLAIPWLKDRVSCRIPDLPNPWLAEPLTCRTPDLTDRSREASMASWRFLCRTGLTTVLPHYPQ